MLHSSTLLKSQFTPGRLLLSGALWVGLATQAPLPSLHAAPAPTPAAVFAAPIPLKVGQSLSFPLPKNATFVVEEGALAILTQTREESLRVKALADGQARIRVKQAGQPDRIISLSIGVKKSLTEQFTRSVASGQLLPPGGGAATGAPASAAGTTTGAPTGTGAPATTGADASDPLLNLPAPTIQVPGLTTAPPSTVSPPPANTTPVTPPPANTTPVTQPQVAPTLPDLQPVPGLPNSIDTSGAMAVPGSVTPGNATPGAGATDLSGSLPTLPAPALGAAPATAFVPASPLQQAPSVQRPAQPVRTTPAAPGPRISPTLPAPRPGSVRRTTNVGYRTTPRLPQNVNSRSARQTIQVSQGLARLISFPDNILSVFFSDPSVMDARAINARTIAVTGVGGGQSTLAVFTSRYPGDAVGKANIYRIQTNAKAGAPAAIYLNLRDPEVVTSAINAAVGDPRVRVFVTKLPDGSFVARLSGIVRNPAEVEAATTAASFYVPRVVSSVYADPTTPSIDSVLSGNINISPEAGLQDNLRRITGNQSIELVPLPTGLAFKAEVGSENEAEALLRVLPTLNQQVIPFIVIRGAANQTDSPYYRSTVPLLQGEDLQLTQRLQSVTGLTSVYAVRASGNSVAIYGQVRTRAEYDTVRRYGFVVAQAAAAPLAGSTQGGAVLRPLGTEGGLASYDPAAGYAKQLGVQFFVRITDPTESTIRNVAVETSIVEVSRNALRNLGVEYGSVAVTGETGGRTTISATGAATVDPIIRTIDPNIRQGTITAGNGFAGGGPTQFLDPVRVTLNALSQRGDARILSRPTVRAVEGMPAQITIGGERPVPRATGGGAGGLIAQEVEFRRFGVIITMRPTVTDDNTIILQIRADVTQPDRTFEINLNGALIPGESVRSIDTTLTIRPGDTVVMGGLMTNDKRQRTSKVPILGDLPILGALFQSKRFENNETELAIFMTPRIEAIQASPNALADHRAAPGYPILPSRQEANSFLNETRTRGN